MSWPTVAIAVAKLDPAYVHTYQLVFVHRVAMPGAHREAGFAPRRSVYMGALALAFCAGPPIGRALTWSYLRRSLGGPRQHRVVAAWGSW